MFHRNKKKLQQKKRNFISTRFQIKIKKIDFEAINCIFNEFKFKKKSRSLSEIYMSIGHTLYN